MSTVGPEELREILDRHGAALALFARQWCDTPEDVVQDALLQLIRQRRTPANLAAWLFTAVRNRAISVARSQRRRARRESHVAAADKPWFEVAPEERLDAAAATEALRHLPVALRETIVARIWGGLTFREVAKLTETSFTTAKRRYHEGLAQLYERLSSPCPKTNHSRNR